MMQLKGTGDIMNDDITYEELVEVMEEREKLLKELLEKNNQK